MSLKRNTLWNLVGSGAPFLLGAICIPYLLKKIGVEAFGILTLIWALIGYFSLFDFGLGRVLTQQVAANIATESGEQVLSLVKTGLLFVTGTGLLGGTVSAALARPLGIKWLHVSVTLQQTTVYSLLIASIGVPLTALTTGLRGVLEAYENFKVVNLLRMLLGLANFALPALSVMVFGPSLEMIVISIIVARLAVLGIHIVQVYKIIPSGWRAARINKENIRNLMSFGAWMTVSNVISPLMVTADRFIISYLLGAGIVAYYTVPFEVLIRVLIIPGALTAALFPRLTSVISVDLQQAKKLYHKCLKVVMSTMLPVTLLIIIGSYWGLTIWLGKDFANHSWLITSILAVGLLFNGMAQIPHAAIQASGNMRATAIIHFSELLLYIPLLFIFLKYFGLLGAAVIWVIRVGGDLIILLLFANKAWQL